jgi:nucleotide-binding universal stress UspA family protein
MSPNTNSKAPRIVVGLDGSPSSLAALRWAVRQAKLTGGFVDAITAWEISAAAMTGFGWAPIALPDRSDMERTAQRALDEAIGLAVDPDDRSRVYGRIVQGAPAKVLLDASADADLLVLGSRGHGQLADALIGSVGLHCVHHARCPVVIMRGMTAEQQPGETGKKVPATSG